MRTTSLSELRAQLTETGRYETKAENRAAKRHRPSWWKTFRFAISVSRVFPLCAIVEAFHKLTVPMWSRFCMSAITMPERSGMTVKLEGWGERAAKGGPVVYVCNHLSMLETILLPPVLLTFSPLAVVAKQSLLHLPCLERASLKMGLIGVGRVSPREDLLHLMKVGGERLAAGHSVLLFPQGTRSRVFSRKRFSSLGAKLAERANVPLVPIAIDSRCMPTRKGGIFKDFGTVDTSRDVRCECGSAIAPGKAREMHEASFDWIANKLESWGMPVERATESKENN